MKNIIKKYWHIIVLVIILLVISIISINYGKYLLSNDNYSPELNPLLSIKRYIFNPTWRTYRTLGYASDSEQADIFRSGIFGILDIILPKWSLAQIFSLISLWVGTISISYLTSIFVKENVTTKNNKTVFLISGIIYLSTLWTAWVFNFNMMPYITQFGFLPLLLLSIYFVLREYNYKNLFLLFISSILFTSTSVIGTLFFVNLVLISLSFIYFGYIQKIQWKKILISFLVFITTQLFWLIPFVNYTINESSDVINSYTNRAITVNTIDLEKQMMTLPNSARLYTRLLGTTDNPSMDSFVFPMSEDFLEYDFYKVIGFIPIFFSILGLIFTILKKKWKILPIWIIVIGSLLLITNQNPPLGFVYKWLQENISIFKQVFRWVSSKMGQVYLITLTITASIGILYFLNFLSEFISKKKLKRIFIAICTIFLTSTLLFYAEYLFKGQLFTQRALVDIPKEYTELSQYLEEDPYGRILYAPPANNGYFREYEWGFVGSQFLGYMIENPLMDMSLSIGSNVGEKAMLNISNIFNSGDSVNLDKELDKYDIKYILVDRSLIKGRYGYSLDWTLVDSYTKNYNKVWSSGFLELYENSFEERKYVETYAGESFERKIPQEPVLNILSLDYTDALLNNEYIQKEFQYKGIDTKIYLNNLNVNNLPSRIKIEEEGIYVSPLLPLVNDISNESYKYFNIYNTDNLFVVGNKVFSKEDLNSGINTEDTWGNIQNIGFVGENTFEEYNLTETLSKMNAGDCSGGDFSVLPDIYPEEIASGFVLKGTTENPCVYTKISLPDQYRYAGSIKLNWETDKDNLFGYCVYSNNKQRCINNEKYLYSKDGFGDMEILLPEVVEGSDDISITVYALNPKGERSEITVRDISLKFSKEISQRDTLLQYEDTEIKSLELRNGDTFSVKIPVLQGDNSYIYEKENTIWQPNIAEDGSLAYEISNENGMYQKVFNQYLNQYQLTIQTDSLSKYLWYWKGENISNIPASLCLTYQGDDKCWIDDTFFDSTDTSVLRIFNPSQTYTKLDASYNSISFASETENILEDFVVMKIPDLWFSYSFKPSISKQYVEQELENMFNSPHSTFYNTSSISTPNTLISIPQAKSNGWLGVYTYKGIPHILKDEVYLDGWKQGWDISEISFDNIYVLYYPNLLAYIGYLLIVVEGIYIIFKIKKDGRK